MDDTQSTEIVPIKQSVTDIRKEIQSELKEDKGKPSSGYGERLARRLGITPDGDLPQSLRIFDSNDGAAESLEKELCATKELLEIAHAVYKANPTPGNAQAVTQLASVVKDILHNMREFHSPTELRDQIVNTVIITLLRRFMEALNSELSKERKNLYSLVKIEYHQTIDDILKRAVSEAGLMSEHIYKEEMQKLSTLLGCA